MSDQGILDPAEDGDDQPPRRKGVRATVTGEVQGVNYRAATQLQAQTEGLNGYVKNLPDGSVEVLLVGDSAAVGRVVEWLWQGPPKAQVDEVVVEDIPADEHDGFKVL